MTARQRELLSRHAHGLFLLLFGRRFNIAPSQLAQLLVVEEGKLREDRMQWGFQPQWALNQGRPPVINAKSETVLEKPLFRHAFETRRCLIPATSFFEWQRRPNGRQPMLIRLKSGQPFFFAGIWCGATPQGAAAGSGSPGLIKSFAILTTEANPLVAPIHDRMPVILPEELLDDYLDPATSLEECRSMLLPYPENQMETFAVSPVVNSPLHDSPECVEPIPPESAQACGHPELDLG